MTSSTAGWRTEDVTKASESIQKLAESFKAAGGNQNVAINAASWLASVSLDLERAAILIDRDRGSQCSNAGQKSLNIIRPAYESFETQLSTQPGALPIQDMVEQTDHLIRQISSPLAGINMILLVQLVLQLQVISSNLENFMSYTDPSSVLHESSLQCSYLPEILSKVHDIERSVLVETEAIKTWTKSMRTSILEADEQLARIGKRFTVAFIDVNEVSHFVDAVSTMRKQVEKQVNSMQQILLTFRDSLRVIEQRTSEQLLKLMTTAPTISDHLNSLTSTGVSASNTEQSTQQEASESLRNVKTQSEQIGAALKTMSERVDILVAEEIPYTDNPDPPISRAAGDISELITHVLDRETMDPARLGTTTPQLTSISSKHEPNLPSYTAGPDSTDPLNAQSAFHVGNDLTDDLVPADAALDLNTRTSTTSDEPYKHAKGRTCQETMQLVDSVLQARLNGKQKLNMNERFALFDWMYHCEAALEHDGSFRPTIHGLLDLKLFPQHQEPPGVSRKTWQDFGKG